jgi:regulator of sigma E protease
MDGNPIGDIGLQPDAGVEPVEASQIVEGSPAESAGLKAGDRIIAFNGQTARNSQELTFQIRENKGDTGKLTVERDGQTFDIEVTAKQSDDGIFRIGVEFGAPRFVKYVPTGITGAASYAVDSNWRIMKLTGKVFGQMFSGERSVKDAGLAGPVGIIQQIGKVVRELGFAGLVGILGIISLNLGIFNLLPIPLLDGGQIMVLGIEKVMSWFGKTLSMAVREKIQIAGLGIILLLMAFTLFLDVSRIF